MTYGPIGPAERDVGVLIRDRARVARAIAQAQVEAVRRHRLLGQPIVLVRDGRVVEEVPPANVDGSTTPAR